MTKIDIFSGFLGAGKTTLIKKMIAESYKGQKLVLIENEFGEIGIDGGFLQDSGINITEMNSGCICCSLVGDFGKALKKVIAEYHPDRILIEPSGVGKLSDVIAAVSKVTNDDVTLGYTVAVADAGKVKVYMKNFGEFYNNQIETASTIILSRTDSISQFKLDTAVSMLREHNQVASIVTTPWDQLTGEQLVVAMEGKASLAAELAKMEMERLEDEDDCCCHHHHDDDDDDEEHEHHHHHHDEDEDDDEHEHHEHDHEHDHEHHHHHHDHEHCHCLENEEEGEALEYGIGTFVYKRRRPFNMVEFDQLIARLWPKSVIRCKGICYFGTERDMCYVFEQAGKQVSLSQAGQWYATMPAEEFEQFKAQNPSVMNDWDDTYGDRMQKLVFIGQNMDREAIETLLDACLEPAD